MSVPRTTINWRSVLTFYLLACAISWPFFWWRDMHTQSWLAWDIPRYFKTSFIMWGPGLAAITSLYLFRKSHPRTITLFGPAPVRSILFYLVPVLALAMVYAPIVGSRVRLIAFIGLVGLFNTLGEELGWRGFLQDALRPLSPVARYALIGAMWEFWHFTNRIAHAELPQIAVRLAIAYPAAMLLSALLGAATDRSRAVLVAVTLHFWLNALWEVPSILKAPAWPVYTVLGFSVLFWIYLLRHWHQSEPGLRRD